MKKWREIRSFVVPSITVRIPETEANGDSIGFLMDEEILHTLVGNKCVVVPSAFVPLLKKMGAKVVAEKDAWQPLNLEVLEKPRPKRCIPTPEEAKKRMEEATRRIGKRK